MSLFTCVHVCPPVGNQSVRQSFQSALPGRLQRRTVLEHQSEARESVTLLLGVRFFIAWLY